MTLAPGIILPAPSFPSPLICYLLRQLNTNQAKSTFHKSCKTSNGLKGPCVNVSSTSWPCGVSEMRKKRPARLEQLGANLKGQIPFYPQPCSCFCLSPSGFSTVESNSEPQSCCGLWPGLQSHFWTRCQAIPFQIQRSRKCPWKLVFLDSLHLFIISFSVIGCRLFQSLWLAVFTAIFSPPDAFFFLFFFFSKSRTDNFPSGSLLSGGAMSHILSCFLQKTLVKARMWGRFFQRPPSSVLGGMNVLVLMIYSGWDSKYISG